MFYQIRQIWMDLQRVAAGNVGQAESAHSWSRLGLRSFWKSTQALRPGSPVAGFIGSRGQLGRLFYWDPFGKCYGPMAAMGIVTVWAVACTWLRWLTKSLVQVIACTKTGQILWFLKEGCTQIIQSSSKFEEFERYPSQLHYLAAMKNLISQPHFSAVPLCPMAWSCPCSSSTSVVHRTSTFDHNYRRPGPSRCHFAVREFLPIVLAGPSSHVVVILWAVGLASELATDHVAFRGPPFLPRPTLHPQHTSHRAPQRERRKVLMVSMEVYGESDALGVFLEFSMFSLSGYLMICNPRSNRGFRMEFRIQYIHVYIYIYTYMYIYIYIYICIYIYMGICIYIYIWVYVYIYMGIYVYIYMGICIYIYMGICIYIYIWVYMYIYIYGYECIYIYIWGFICIYIYMGMWPSRMRMWLNCFKKWGPISLNKLVIFTYSS